MFRKIAIFAILFFAIFFSTPVVAAVNSSSNLPSLNPLCWQRKDCKEVRAKYLPGTPSAADLESGFVTGNSAAPCTSGKGEEEWGRCLPAGVTETEISFGGEKKFANMGDFILLMYKYLVSIASIIAVIMIIVAGLQWVTSGGNSEAITSAKHRIGGAIIGLFIAYMSYFILNTVNPALVNFRIPQVWLVRPQSLIPEFCNQVPGATDKNKKLDFYYYASETDQTSDVDGTKASKDAINYGTQKDGHDQFVFSCGRRFLVKDGGTQTCLGGLCPSVVGDRQACGKDYPAQTASCHKGELRIHFNIEVNAFDLGEQARQTGESLTKGLLITKLMKTKWIIPNAAIRGVCKNNNLLYLANNGEATIWADSDASQVVEKNPIPGSPYYEYTKAYSKLADFENEGWQCGQGGALVGYFMRIETSVSESAVDFIRNIAGRGGAATAIIAPVLSLVANDNPCTEPNLNIGYDKKTGQAIFGAYGQDIKNLNYYIPIDKLKEGLQLNLPLTIDKLESMIGHCGSVPSVKDGVNGDPVE
jgi:hypothetical protein